MKKKNAKPVSREQHPGSTLSQKEPCKSSEVFLTVHWPVRIHSNVFSSKQKNAFFFTNLVPTERKGPECVSMTVCHHAAWWQVATQSVNKRQAIPRGDDVIGTSVSTGGRAERDQAVPSGWKGRNNRFAMFFTVLCLVFSFVFASNWFLKPGH